MSHLPSDHTFQPGNTPTPPKPLIPRLTVVGAGPGDPELITLKAVNALRTADVVLYDALVNEAILQHAAPSAALVYVGKRKGAKAYAQSEINERIVAYAHCCGHVVRLKGGDPFVFGRGHEELLYAQQNGLQTAYVPGISSAIAAASAIGVPVTLRGASRGFWVVTGTTDTGDLNPEIAAAAQSDATVVVLMGLTKLTEITGVFREANKATLPVAVIQNATLPNQREVLGTVETITALVDAQSFTGPAVIILGEVVRHQVQFHNIPGLAAAINPEYAAQ
jgi:uroporphyrin-III C-methyltransferase